MSFSARELGGEAKDGSQPLPPGAQASFRLVPAEPPPTDQGATATALAEATRSLRILRYHRKLVCDLGLLPRGVPRLEAVAEPPLTTSLDNLGEVQCAVAAIQAATATLRPFSSGHVANLWPEEPDAGNLHVRIREGGGRSSPSPTSIMAAAGPVISPRRMPEWQSLEGSREMESPIFPPTSPPGACCVESFRFFAVNPARGRRFISHGCDLTFIEIDAEVARVHAHLWADLESRGQLIGTHDLWIAATAISIGFQLASANVREFKRVPELAILNWQ